MWLLEKLNITKIAFVLFWLDITNQDSRPNVFIAFIEKN